MLPIIPDPQIPPAEAERLAGTDIPALLAEVERLRAEVAGRQASVQRWKARALEAEQPSLAEGLRDGRTAREGILNYLTNRAVCDRPRPADEADALLDAHRAEVLAEAAAPTDGQCGYDDYHDPHEWADRPGAWCPGHGYDDAEAGDQR